MKNETIFPMNLQLFAEGEGTESTVNAEPVATVEPQQTTTDNTPTEQVAPTESVNVETANPQVEEKPVQTAEENAQFAKIRRDYEAKIETETAKARQTAKDEFIASQGYSWNNKPITTEAEYNQALLEKSYQDKGIDPNVINEAIKNNPTVKEAQEALAKQKQEQAKQQQYIEFNETYPGVKAEDIPLEVWKEFNNGTPLKVAYAIAENAKLKAELEAFKQGSKAKEVNAKNAVNSTGSVTGNGTLPVGFITKDVFEANKKDQAWMSTNYDMLKSSMTKW